MANLYNKAGLVNIPVGYQDGFLYNIKPEDNTLGFRFNRDSAATRVNKEGLIEDVGYFSPELVQNGDFEEIGAEEVTNGTFETDSDWTKQTGWTISDGKAIATSTNGSLYQANDFVSGKSYRIRFDITSYESGGLICRFNNDETNIFNSVGTHTLYFKSDNSFDFVYFLGDNSFTGSIDNVSVKEVGQNWTFGGEAIIDNELVSFVSASNTYSYIRQDISSLAASLYRISIEVKNYVSGAVQVGFQGSSPNLQNLNVSADGVYTIELSPNANGDDLEISREFAGGAFNFDIDNVSVVEIQGDKPRIDYTDSLTSPSFLLEPQRTNLITYSEDFSKWIKYQSSVNTNEVISPDGSLNADKIIENTANSTHFVAPIVNNIPSSGTATLSVFAKKGENNWIKLVQYTNYVNFDLNNGVVGNSSAISSNIINYGNGWYKCIMNFNIAGNGANVDFKLGENNTSNWDDIYTGDGESGVYLWGAQLEAGSYATSYIPTSGSTATRTQETCNGAGSASTFNDSEGVLYAEISALSNTFDNSKFITISDGTYNNRASILFSNGATNQIRTFLRVGGVSQIDVSTNVTDVTDFNKVAFSYKENDFKVYINGFLVSTDTSGSVWTSGTITKLSFSEINTSAGLFNGKVKGVYVFNKALTDDELQQLTGPEYNSFAALAAAYNYTVI